MMNVSTVIISKKIVCSVPRHVLWTFLSDTDRLNKAVGLPAIEFIPYPDRDRKGYYKARARVLGIQVSYDELPYSWVERNYYTVIREFSFSFLKRIGVKYIFRSVPQGCELELEIEVSPDNIFTRILTKGILSRLAFKDVFTLVTEFEKQYKKPSLTASATFETMYHSKAVELEKRMHDRALSGCNKDILNTFCSFLIKGSDLDVVRMRPFELASRWNYDKYETLKLCIAATKAGILDLHWTVLCPNCRGISSDSLTLSEIKSESHCDTCNIKYGSDLATGIEARFTVHPAIRIARHETYCIGGPANMPQIVVQLRVAPQSTHSEHVELAPCSLRVRTFQTEEIISINVTETSPHNCITATCEGSTLSVSSTDVKSGIVTFTVVNATAHEVLVVIERENWHDTAATAAIVTSMQEFRDLFPSEAVAPGCELGISSLAVLFTDLKGSTALYHAIGDTKAFEFVQNHFRYLTERAAKHHGGILKTMGDAIMASFASGIDALSAALEMQREWKLFCSEFGDYNDIALKIGIYEGSAIAINNRGKLDYFGTTVNIAGRLQKFSQGGDIIISEDMIDHNEISSVLTQFPQASIEHFDAELKGLEQEHFRLLRISPNQ